MARPGDELVDPSGLRLVFRDTAISAGGAAVSLDWFVPPGGRLVALPHVHPHQVEVFEIVSGRARYRVGRHVHERSAPYTYGVPPGALHGPAANCRPHRAQRAPDRAPRPAGPHARRRRRAVLRDDVRARAARRRLLVRAVPRPAAVGDHVARPAVPVRLSALAARPRAGGAHRAAGGGRAAPRVRGARRARARRLTRLPSAPGGVAMGTWTAPSRSSTRSWSGGGTCTAIPS